MLSQLSNRVSVSGQIQPEDVQVLKAQGVEVIINNRPDRESPNQPSSDDIAKACEAQGISYFFNPISDSLSEEIINNSADHIRGADGPKTHLFCTSGKRCTALWCFANAESEGVDEVIEAARNAGFELGYMRTMLMTYASAY